MKKRLYLGIILITVLALTAGTAYVCGTRAAAAVAPPGPTSSSSLSAQPANNSTSMGIWVSGQGKVTAVPDVAVLSMGVEAQASTVEEAMDKASAAMNRVMESLRKNGVADKDIRTEWFNIYAVREWVPINYPIDTWKEEPREVLVGYRVTNMVTVKIRNIGATGQIIDAAAKAGGDLIRINGVSFTLDDPSIYEYQAREAAIADAMAKAEQLARLAGVGLGKPFYISESGAYYPVYRTELTGGDVWSSTPISPGETVVTLSVQMAFAIE